MDRYSPGFFPIICELAVVANALYTLVPLTTVVFIHFYASTRVKYCSLPVLTKPVFVPLELADGWFILTRTEGNRRWVPRRNWTNSELDGNCCIALNKRPLPQIIITFIIFLKNFFKSVIYCIMSYINYNLLTKKKGKACKLLWIKVSAKEMYKITQ